MRDILIEGDFRKLRAMWAENMPGMPQPETDEDAEIAMHQARTAAKTIPLRYRIWSHCWLGDRGLASLLPAELIPGVQVVDAYTVGIAFGVLEPSLIPASKEIVKYMEHRVLDLMSGSVIPSAARLKRGLDDARGQAMRKYLGRGE